MNRRQKIIISVTGIFLVLLILVGLTYAYFLTQIQGNEEERSITVTTANLRLAYDNGDGTVITGDKIEPGYPLVPKTFKVTNEGNVNITYGVYLIDVINTFERKEDITYILTCKNEDNTDCNNVTEAITFPSGIAEMVQNEIEPNKTQTYTLTVTYKDTGTDQSVDMNKTLQAKVQIFGENSKGVIIPYASNTLAFNIVNNASNNLNETILDLNQSILSKVANEPSAFIYGKTNPNIYPSNRTSPSNYYIAYACDYTINSSGKFTLGTADCPVTIMDSTYVYTENLAEKLAGKFAYWSSSSITNTSNLTWLFKITTDKSKITNNSIAYIQLNTSISTEKILSTDYDDYGLSYYYRGGVESNYVNFADMCWRIVRIEGDGSVKLILEDQNNTCETSEGSWDIPVSSAANAGRTGSFGYTYDNTNNIYKINYLNLDGLAKNYGSSMATAFKNFQGTFTFQELSKLKSGNWCFNDTAYISENVDISVSLPLTEVEKQQKYLNKEMFYYDSYIRLYSSTTKSPTLKCNGRILDKFGDNKTLMYVGTLTADEIVYAGGKINTSNSTFYLANDYQRGLNLTWWSLSPLKYSETSDDAFRLYSYGNLKGGAPYNDFTVGTYKSFRPAVTLLPNITIDNGGNGTQEKPYVIE